MGVIQPYLSVLRAGRSAWWRQARWKMSARSEILPKVLVFDLDGCVWRPEMYELWGGGGSPFQVLKNGNVRDRAGTEVSLLGDIRNIFVELNQHADWSSSIVAVASSCDEPSWARECIDNFIVGDNLNLKDVFDRKHIEIYKRSKDVHLRNISKNTGIDLSDIIFFDNEYGNCQTVARIGVTVVYTPEGVTRKAFTQGLEAFPAPGEIIGPKRRDHW